MDKDLKRMRKIEYSFFVGIFILGCFLRFYKLGALPGGLQRDEATVAMNSYTMFHDGTDFVGNINPFYMADWGDGHSNMYVLLTQIPLLVSGGVMSNVVSRLPQAFVSILTLLAVFGIGKETFGVKFGLWSMFITAVCPWHIMMSRWGLDANLAPGFMMIAFYFFIKAQKKEKYLLLSGLFYGLTLYTYAITWVVVPITIALEIAYMLYYKRLKIDKISVAAAFALFVVAIPPMLFVLVNNGILEDIRTPFFSIVAMNRYRGDEVKGADILNNLKQAYHLFVYQDGAGEIWEIRKPWGLFYDFGRLAILIGGIWILIDAIRSFFKRQFSWEMVYVLQVIGSAVCCLVTFPHLHRINVLYIPMIFCGAYGICNIIELIAKKNSNWGGLLSFLLAFILIVYVTLFWMDYTGEYKNLVEAYWGVGMDQCVDIALEACEENNLNMITVEKAAQWPKLMLYTETTSEVFSENVVYDSYPQPWSFVTRDGILVQTRIDYEAITDKSVYIIYFTDKEFFEEDYYLSQVYDWYVAVPK